MMSILLEGGIGYGNRQGKGVKEKEKYGGEISHSPKKVLAFP